MRRPRIVERATIGFTLLFSPPATVLNPYLNMEPLRHKNYIAVRKYISGSNQNLTVLWLTGLDSALQPYSIYDRKSEAGKKFCEDFLRKFKECNLEHISQEELSGVNLIGTYEDKTIIVWGNTVDKEELSNYIHKVQPKKVVFLRQPNNFVKYDFLSRLSNFNLTLINQQVPRYEFYGKDNVGTEIYVDEYLLRDNIIINGDVTVINHYPESPRKKEGDNLRKKVWDILVTTYGAVLENIIGGSCALLGTKFF